MLPQKFAARLPYPFWAAMIGAASIFIMPLLVPSTPAGLGLIAPAYAGDCSQDIANLSQKRQNVIQELNRLAKSSPKGQLDPAISCPKLRGLAAADQELFAYLQKNKDWCMVPDEAIGNFKAGLGRDQAIASKACAVAAQIKKNQEAGILGGGQKLPSGPL